MISTSTTTPSQLDLIQANIISSLLVMDAMPDTHTVVFERRYRSPYLAIEPNGLITLVVRRDYKRPAVDARAAVDVELPYGVVPHRVATLLHRELDNLLILVPEITGFEDDLSEDAEAALHRLRDLLGDGEDSQIYADQGHIIETETAYEWLSGHQRMLLACETEAEALDTAMSIIHHGQVIESGHTRVMVSVQDTQEWIEALWQEKLHWEAELQYQELEITQVSAD